MVNRKHLSQNMAFGLFRLLSLSVVGILFAILGFIIYKGIGVINWAGLIPFIQIKGKIIYRQSDIDKLLQKHYFESWKE